MDCITKIATTNKTAISIFLLIERRKKENLLCFFTVEAMRAVNRRVAPPTPRVWPSAPQAAGCQSLAYRYIVIHAGMHETMPPGGDMAMEAVLLPHLS